jgi:transcription elongation factor GreA
LDIIKDAMKKLEEEAQRIEYEIRVELPKEINIALAHGDISENAELDAAKERKSTLLARLAQINRRLADLSRIDVAGIPHDRSGLGSEVTVEDLDSGEEISYTLVIPEVADGRRNLVSVAAPVGRALMNRKAGDSVTVQVPKGTLEFEVRKVVTMFGDVIE